jgi:hypothetical protein
LRTAVACRRLSELIVFDSISEEPVPEFATLPAPIAGQGRKPLEHVRRTLAAGEQLEVVAGSHSGADGLLVLTTSRIVFVWQAGAFGGVKILARERGSIVAVQVDGNDLLVRDAGQLWRYKNLSPIERGGEIAARLVAAGARDSALAQPQDGPARSALRIIPAKSRRIAEQLLRADENVHAVFVGAGGQTMIAADDRIIVVKAGFLAGATLGSKTLDFPYNQISGIELHTGAMTGYLQITSPGFQGNLPGSYWSKDKQHDPWKLPNCIPVGRGAAAKWQPTLALVRERISKGVWSDGIGAPPTQATPISPTPTSPGSGLTEQLKGLAELHEAGALSDEEFTQAKQKLLG